MDSSWSTNSGHLLTLWEKFFRLRIFKQSTLPLPPPPPSCKVASLRCRTDLTRENFFCQSPQYIYISRVPFLSPIAPLLKATKTRKVISNANWTEWKAIWFEIPGIRVNLKSNESAASSLWNHKFCSWDNAIIFPSLATHVLTVLSFNYESIQFSIAEFLVLCNWASAKISHALQYSCWPSFDESLIIFQYIAYVSAEQLNNQQEFPKLFNTFFKLRWIKFWSYFNIFVRVAQNPR